jgi:hypothetical protein
MGRVQDALNKLRNDLYDVVVYTDEGGEEV